LPPEPTLSQAIVVLSKKKEEFLRMPKKKNGKKSSRATLSSVKKEMAMPVRVASVRRQEP
jgi:hypothetical protein